MIDLLGFWMGLVRNWGPFHQSSLLIIWGAGVPRDAISAGFDFVGTWNHRDGGMKFWMSSTRFATSVLHFEGKACIQANVIVLSVHANISRFFRLTDLNALSILLVNFAPNCAPHNSKRGNEIVLMGATFDFAAIGDGKFFHLWVSLWLGNQLLHMHECVHLWSNVFHIWLGHSVWWSDAKRIFPEFRSPWCLPWLLQSDFQLVVRPRLDPGSTNAESRSWPWWLLELATLLGRTIWQPLTKFVF